MTWFTYSPNVLWAVAAMVAALATGSLLRLQHLMWRSSPAAIDRLRSLRSWWLVAFVVIGAALLGPLGASGIFTLVSLLALHEFHRIVKPDVSRVLRIATFGLVPVSYMLVAFGATTTFYAFVPLAGVALLSITLVGQQQTKGFLAAVSTQLWGLLVTTFLLAHVVLLFSLPGTAGTTGAGWFLLLVTLTEVSDICQALVGRRMGRRKLAPIVSPNKTWEGLMGGIAATLLLALLAGPWLTTLTYWEAAIAGLLVAVAGVFGDLNISALKRDAGVKDSGTVLPGQGGILDRIDSLTFTAPAFYYFVLLVMT